ncbi:uncharacterized protein K460DRAFT_367854 [Cucurbitaria berberidis CBS 394.84]|uniref:Uncharacterized protein n=1 Tax=Cucurbitaria berberidis CBS 394.84 TaxID=1168544 RepID=A0A9P4L5F8_9PLEO|nr:uncharacterized protein K460DRAFT_367854 [Cucurbitaria berberidis CBS 394.84]KAF1842916.1 hypothetical protein K460DRAFT_367854 [Cucurbitaria berberidis CBS 394.84]
MATGNRALVWRECQLPWLRPAITALSSTELHKDPRLDEHQFVAPSPSSLRHFLHAIQKSRSWQTLQLA